MSCVIYRTSRVLNSLFQKSERFWKIENQRQILPSIYFTSTTTTARNFIIQKRSSSFRSSDFVHDKTEYPEVEVIKNPPEWKYVEKLLPLSIVPKPKEKSEYPSGWKPPKNQLNPETTPYFVQRTKNYMIPVYLHTTHRGLRKTTVIRKIQGNIWELEKELREIVEKARGGKLCASRINEMSCQIRFHGDYVNLIKDYLMNKGF